MRAALAVVLLSACTINLDHAPAPDAASANDRLCKVSTNTQSCLDADSHSDFTWIQSDILKPKCTFSACHDGGTGCAEIESTPAAKVNMCSQSGSFMSLVGAPSALDTTRQLVVPGNPAQSFLMVMTGQIKLDEADPPLDAIPKDKSGNVVGTMPQASGIMCCQKLDAMARWITAGAMND